MMNYAQNALLFRGLLNSNISLAESHSSNLYSYPFHSSCRTLKQGLSKSRNPVSIIGDELMIPYES